jgi:hypothetical protein
MPAAVEGRGSVCLCCSSKIGDGSHKDRNGGKKICNRKSEVCFGSRRLGFGRNQVRNNGTSLSKRLKKEVRMAKRFDCAIRGGSSLSTMQQSAALKN